MADAPITTRRAFGDRVHLFQFTTIAALTAAADKARFIVPFPARIVDVIVDSEVAGSGGTSDIFDIHVNGTTIYTTQANRPTLLVGNTGMFTEAGEPELPILRTGDVITIDVDQIATTGSAKNTVCIVIAQR